MAMNKLLKEVDTLVFKELQEANRNFPLFASVHEAEGVIREEMEEAKDELSFIQQYFNYFWWYVKKNKSADAKEQIKNLRESATKLACEAIQVAAMCEKFEMSLGGKDAE